jgi:hypothetical protein
MPAVYTIAHALDAAGEFDKNPANVQAKASNGLPLYTGPVKFPMMVYEPEGKMRQVEPARREPTATGPVDVPARHELIDRQVNNEEELATAIAEGWHTRPDEALFAGGHGPAPLPRVQDLADRAADLDKKLAAMREKLISAGLDPDEE